MIGRSDSCREPRVRGLQQASERPASNSPRPHEPWQFSIDWPPTTLPRSKPRTNTRRKLFGEVLLRRGCCEVQREACLLGTTGIGVCHFSSGATAPRVATGPRGRRLLDFGRLVHRMRRLDIPPFALQLLLLNRRNRIPQRGPIASARGPSGNAAEGWNADTLGLALPSGSTRIFFTSIGATACSAAAPSLTDTRTKALNKARCLDMQGLPFLNGRPARSWRQSRD